MAPSEIHSALFQLLDEMERAAVHEPDGFPVGLHWFVRYIQRRDALEREPRNHEVQWTRELTRLLVQLGHRATAEHFYPQSKDRCDIVLHLPEIGDHWIEVKGCWPAYLYERRANGSYRKHLFAAAHDIDKLRSLAEDLARGWTMVLVAFDDLEYEIQTRDIDVIEKSVEGLVVNRDYREWWSTGTLIYRTRIWMWTTVRQGAG